MLHVMSASDASLLPLDVVAYKSAWETAHPTSYRSVMNEAAINRRPIFVPVPTRSQSYSKIRMLQLPGNPFDNFMEELFSGKPYNASMPPYLLKGMSFSP